MASEKQAEPPVPSGVKELILELSGRPDVLGVALFGSTARGDERPDSDIDVYVLVKEGSWRDVEIRNGKHYEFVYSSAEESEAFWRANPHDYVQLWTDARILLDREGKLERFRKNAERVREGGPSLPSAKAVEHRRFDAEDQLRAVRALGFSDPATAALALHGLVEALSQFYFTMHGQWVPPPKERLKGIRVAAPAVGHAFDAFYTARDGDEKLAAAEALVGELFGRRLGHHTGQ